MATRPTPTQRAAAGEEESASGVFGAGGAAKFQTDIADAQRWLDVTGEMMKAGARGDSRIKAGVKAWYKQRQKRGAPKRGGTKAADALRFLGKPQAAIWIDRFFGKYDPEAAKAQKKANIGGTYRSGGGGGGSGGGSETTARMAGNLLGIKVRLGALTEVVSDISDDISDIKELLMPKDLLATGRTVKKPFGGAATERMRQLYGSGLEGDELNKKDRERTIPVRYDPLAPAGEQFRQVSKKGKLSSKKLNEGFIDNATKMAAMATAKLALKIQKKDEAKTELKKKRAYKDLKETDPLVADDPLLLLRVDMNDKFEKVFKLLGGMEGVGKGKKGLLQSLFDSPLMQLLGKAGLVGLAGFLGYQVGSWLNDTFKLDQKINDGIDKVMGWFGKGNQAAVEAATKTDKFSDQLIKTNKKLIGSGWSLVGQGKYANNVTNTIFTYDELPNDVKLEFKKRKLAGFETAKSNIATTIPESALVAETPEIEPPKPTGSLGVAMSSTSMESDTYKQRLRLLGDVIASGESRGDYNIFNKGTIGSNEGKIGREDLSKMTIAEYLRRGSLGKDDPMKMFAVGKYQIIPKTMKKIIKALKLNPDTTTLSPEIQDQMFEYLVGSKPAVRKYLEGKTDDMNAAFLSLSKEWASVGVPEDIIRPDGTVIKAGESYYSGVGGNIAHTSAAEITAALNTSPYSIVPSPSMPASVVDAQSRALVAANMPSGGATTVIPVAVDNSTRTNTMTRQSAPRASSVSQDPSFVRTAGRDVLHPVAVLG